MEMGWCTDKGLPHSTLTDWEPEDRAKLHAYLMEEASRCVMCGTQPWEWAENPRAYDAVEIMCKGCYIRAIASDNNESTPGTTIQLVPASKEHLLAQREAYEKAQARKARDRVTEDSDGARGLHSPASGGQPKLRPGNGRVDSADGLPHSGAGSPFGRSR